MRAEALSQGNRLKDFEIKTLENSDRKLILLGCCDSVANAISRSLPDPTSSLQTGPDSWPYCIETSISDLNELTLVLKLFSNVLTLTRIDGLDEAIALDFHNDPNSESDGAFARTEIGSLAFSGKYQFDSTAGPELAERLTQVAKTHPRYRSASIVVSVEGTKHTFGERLAKGVARRLQLPFVASHWNDRPTSEAKEGRKNLELQQCSIDFDLNRQQVLIVDDLWRTGVSTKSVAAQARQLGAATVLGLCCTRTLRN
jgi:adenine/guanine phosphoribosyltransferase-like PRPP-binding protein